ncbi:MAG: excinuclease ABC subunit UvrA [Syntrophobacteraceae bacterium]
MPHQEVIRLRGLRQHNLKNLDLDIPLNRLIALTGVSGSGKSSLALHTLYAEGQRRYIETFSPYARQFLERMDPPAADLIEGIPPSIAIESGTAVRSSRSTVGTITEINDYLKLLFARLAVPYCPSCGKPVTGDTPETICKKLSGLAKEERVLIAFPFHIEPGEPWKEQLVSQGFMRLYADGAILDLESLQGKDPAEFAGNEVLVVVDRLLWGKAEPGRIDDSVSTAFRMGKGRVAVIIMPDRIRRFSSDLCCADCGGNAVPSPSPNLFSFNSPIGACPKCRGFGRNIGVDLDLVIPDHSLTLERGAIKPFGTDREEYFELLQFCKKENIPVDVPFRELDESARKKIIGGTKKYYGIKGFFEWLETKTYKMHVRVYLSRYRAYSACDACGGTRFQPASLLYRLRGVTIAEVASWSIERCSSFFARDWPETSQDPAASLLLTEIRGRLQFLMAVGLHYLSLDRQSRTLSGGEVQRVHLTRALGSALVNVLYVLDEPSVGLHARDQKRLMDQLNRLVRMGNSVVMVEHDPGMIRFCDEVIDMGPGGGERGGEVLFQGPPDALGKSVESLTGAYLSGRKSVMAGFGSRRTAEPGKSLIVRGARENNLKGIEVRIPLGLLVGVSGVSGSGKSTLIEKTLYNGWLRKTGRPTECPGLHDGLDGAESIAEMVMVDQQPLGRTPRANLLTYTHALDPLRKMLAATPEAVAKGFSTRHFSFNVAGGRCDTCNGEGFERVEMQFLADVFLRCPQCGGKRFKEEVLDIKIRGVSIGDMLDMTAREILDHFRENQQLASALEPVIAIGLDYIRLGQPLSTISGGEAQRVKLVHYLARGSAGNGRDRESNAKLFILDEPTTGLHPDDISKLIRVLHKLVDKGNTVLVVEHNLDFLAACDWIVDLGPEGGERGGELVCEGTPESVSELSASITGRFLKERLAEAGNPEEHEEQFMEAAEPQAAFSEDRPKPLLRVLSSGRSGKADEAGTSGENALSAYSRDILVRGAREHNLALDEIRIPRGKLSVLTGLSGSGKSTLAFDVIFAEGQRRYLECLSSYVRQYFKIMEKPDVDQIVGLPPTIAIEQRTSQFGRRSTVGTITEIYHFLRLLFSKLGKQHCPQCGKGLETLTVDSILSRIRDEAGSGPVTLLAPLVQGRKGIYRDLFARLSRMGFEEVKVDGRYLSLDPMPALARHREHDIEAVLPGLERSGIMPDELADAVRRGLAMGGGILKLESAVNRSAGRGRSTDTMQEPKVFSRHLYCPACDKGLPPLDPRLFSFNSRHGLCPACMGMGRVDRINTERLAGGPDVSLRDGLLAFLGSAIWRGRSKGESSKLERLWARELGVDSEKPAASLAKVAWEAILHGMRGKFPGVLEILGKISPEDDAWKHLQPLFDEAPCPDCEGSRLNEQARSVHFHEHTISDLSRFSVSEFRRVWQSFKFLPEELPIVGPISKEVGERLTFLEKVGLSYLSMDRSGDTLSGGETQRIRLAAQLGSNLRGICYILDEPTIGLHPADNKKLLESLETLRNKGNTVIVVEHDPETMKRADMLIELGPGAGSKGGKIVAMGSLDQLASDSGTLTGKWFGSTLSELYEIPVRKGAGAHGWLEFTGVRARNLKGMDVRIPLGLLITVTGVSGAGKSTLVNEVVYRGLCEVLRRRFGEQASRDFDKMSGHERLHRILEVDHNPIGRTPRSIPATYIGVWDEIRKLFALLPDSRTRGFGPGRFSFNVKGGRCEECKGQGQSKVEMSFLPDVFVPCESCGGRRFNAETLSIEYRGKNIADVLEMTVDDAVEVFSPLSRISHPLKVLSNLGLGYLKLGQSSPTLSGGEAQRIKLAGELGNSRNATLYILDEPTTGLHRADIKRLMDVLRALTDHGHTVLVIEHNTDFIWASDYVIDIGPGSGDKGGDIVVQGTPEEIIEAGEKSLTGQALFPYRQEQRAKGKKKARGRKES